MLDYTAFAQDLHDSLSHLYDPSYRVPASVSIALGLAPDGAGADARSTLCRAILDMKPGPDVPTTARSWRLYHLLDYRYLQGLTQEDTAHHLGITSRHLRREQQDAIDMLARRLWQRRQQKQPVQGDAVQHPGRDAQEDSGWHAQIRKELASLEQSAPAAVSHVAEVIEGVRPIADVLASKHHVRLHIVSPLPDMLSALHPTLLRQLLLTAVEKLVQQMDAGEIVLAAGDAGVQIEITVRAHSPKGSPVMSSEFIEEMLKALGGDVIVESGDRFTSVRLLLPLARKVQVLVVDDNEDLVTFYRRYTTHTRFQITSLSAGLDLFPSIEDERPDVIVLDVMLPDVDGWELLTKLHEHPETRSIPVIVCSVVRREELALALGASLYLPKPVRRRAFLNALEHALAESSQPLLAAKTEQQG